MDHGVVHDDGGAVFALAEYARREGMEMGKIFEKVSDVRVLADAIHGGDILANAVDVAFENSLGVEDVGQCG